MPSSLQFHRINTTNPTTITTSTTALTSCHKQSLNTTPTRPHVTSRVPTVSIPDSVARFHELVVRINQCCSAVVQTINAPISTVWSVVRCFDKPQVYKRFLKSCHVIDGDGDVGSLREVHVVSGLPAASSTERLEILDDKKYVMSFSVIGGDHRLNNYRSVTTLHATPSGTGTVVVESYVVDVPMGNTKDETCVFVDTIVRCNLQSLAQVAEKMAKNNKI